MPLVAGVRDLAAAGVVPGGTGRNLVAVERFTDFGDLDPSWQLILADAQTSGGLLISVAASRTLELVAALEAEGTPVSAVIGDIVADQPGTIEVR